MKPHEVKVDKDQSTYIMTSSSSSSSQLHHPIKTEESPATEALELLLQNEEPNSLMFDLTELLKRDPTLSSLTAMKNESDNLNLGMSNPPSVGGKRSPVLMNSNSNTLLGLSDFDDSALSGPPTATNVFGSDSAAAGPTLGSSPSTFANSFLVLKQAQPASALKMEMDTSPAIGRIGSSTSMTGINSDDSSSLLKLELNDLDVDINDYFTNDSSRNVSFGVPYNSKSQLASSSGNPVNIKSENSNTGFSNSSSNFWQVEGTGGGGGAGDGGLLFGSTSFGSQSGGVTFATSKDLLSSSVPASIFHNSPLSDILTELSSPPPPGPPSGSGSVSACSPSVSPSLPSHSPSHAGPERHSTLHKLLLRKDPVCRPSPVRSPESRKTLEKIRNSMSAAAANPLLCQQLSKSAPTQHSSYLDRVLWSRREPRQHISSVCSVGNDSSIADEVSDVLSGLSPNELPDIESDDEEDLSLDDSQDEYSDDEDASGSQGDGKSGSRSKKDRHFWQYNVQAKGPKGQKIVVETKIEDPHVLNEIVDPVFSGDVKLQGIKHSGKARRGDGNDLTSNPKKLAAIGKELDQLSKVINDLTPVSEMPFNTRCKSRKEKNKLASRACRLKKKAQHEANKLKCHGLEEEHHELTIAIARAKEILTAKVEQNVVTVDQGSLTSEIDLAVKHAMKNKVAGQTTEYVNRQIERYLKNV